MNIDSSNKIESCSLPWKSIDTVFLDMDGTLLDLHFDNHFWTRFVPARYGEKHGLTTEEAFNQIFPHMLALRGTLDWYSVHYWSEYLSMDVLAMKSQAAERINPRPGALDFLAALNSSGKQVILATNAHEDTLPVKFENSGIDQFLDLVVTSHEVGVAKENQQFWQYLAERNPFQRERSLFIDDNAAVLSAASEYGIGHLLTIAQPDMHQSPQDHNGYEAIEHFDVLTADILR